MLNQTRLAALAAGFLLLAVLFERFLNGLLNALISSGGIYDNVISLLIVGVFAWVVYSYAYRNAGRLIGSTAKMEPFDSVKPCRFLVMGYSPDFEPDLRKKALDEIALRGIDHVALSNDAFRIKQAELGDEPWKKHNKWQQNIRAIKPHLKNGTLERVLILRPSDTDEGYREFETYLRSALRHHPSVTIGEVTMSDNDDSCFRLQETPDIAIRDYMSYRYVYEGVARAFVIAHGDVASADRFGSIAICVDATAGNKAFSIAAGIATLNRNAYYSYVDTNTGDPVFFNASVQLAS